MLDEVSAHQIFFFFNDTATTEIYTLSLHDALPICNAVFPLPLSPTSTLIRRQSSTFASRKLRKLRIVNESTIHPTIGEDRKSTRLNSSHANISYAVFCLKKTTNTQSLDSTHPRSTT